MKKSHFVIVIVLVGSTLLGYLVYRMYFYKPPMSVFQLVPPSAGLYAEVHHPMVLLKGIEDKKLDLKIDFLPPFASFFALTRELDSIHTGQTNWRSLLTYEKLFFSVHQTSNTQLGVLWYLPVSSTFDNESFRQIVNEIKKVKGYRFDSRKYHEVNIFEIRDKDGVEALSYVIMDNIIIASATGFLIEDVIRNAGHGGFTEMTGPVRGHQDEEQITVYINYTHLPDLLSVFASPGQKPVVELMSRFAKGSRFETAIDQDQIHMTGFTKLRSGKDLVSLCLANQPVNPTFFKLLPRDADMAQFFALKSGEILHQTLRAYDTLAGHRYNLDWLTLEDRFGVRADEFMNIISNELVLIDISGEDGSPQKCLMLKTASVGQAKAYLNMLALRLAEQQGDSVYSETYGDFEMVQLNIAELPATLFGKHFTGFRDCYFSIIGDFVIIGSDLALLRRIINDVENENTWGKSVELLSVVESKISAANYFLLLRPNSYIKNRYSHFAEDYHEFFDKQLSHIKVFDQIVFQVGNLGGELYTSLDVVLGERQNEVATPRFAQAGRTISFPATISTKPMLFKVKGTRNWQLMVQDEDRNLHMVDGSGRIVWSEKTEEPIVSQIFEINLTKTTKQYLFATRSQIQAIDKDGIPQDGFPINIKGLPIDQFGVLDYDKSRNYRFAFADLRGNLILADVEGNFLEGWSPKYIDGKLIAPLRHIRIKGKDCLLAVQEKGMIFLFNRRGEPYNGFPVDLKSELVPACHIVEGADFGKTTITVLTSLGELVTINLEGESLERFPFQRASRDSRFVLVRDASERGFVVARQDYSRITMFNRKGKELFTVPTEPAARFRYQYYRTSLIDEVFIIQNDNAKVVRLYDAKGSEISIDGFPNQNDVSIIVSDADRKLTLYTTFGQDVVLHDIMVR